AGVLPDALIQIAQYQAQIGLLRRQAIHGAQILLDGCMNPGELELCAGEIGLISIGVERQSRVEILERELRLPAAPVHESTLIVTLRIVRIELRRARQVGECQLELAA